jgi:hypothetical protein
MENIGAIQHAARKAVFVVANIVLELGRLHAEKK